VVSPGDWLVSTIVSTCPQSKLQLGAEITHCLFVQGGQNCCCFHQVAAALPYSCNSAWLLPLPALWGNSVLNTALCPTRPALGSTTCPTLGSWLIASPLLSAFVSFHSLRIQHWEFSSLPHPLGQVQCSIPTSTVGVSLQFAVYVFFVWLGGFSLHRGCTGLCSLGVGKGVEHGAWNPPVHSAHSHKQLWNQMVERNGVAFLSVSQHKETFHVLGSWMSQNSILIDALSSDCWERKKRKK
jgi:hypothetical protein